MKKDFYGILDEQKNVVVVNDITKYRWPDSEEEFERRRVGNDTIKGVRVSTVFLGMNHAFCISDQDEWFETMVFGGEMNEYQARYATWEQAYQGHKATVARVLELETMSTGKHIVRKFSKLMKRLARDD